MTDVLVICGAAGVGKSSVAREISLQLERSGVPHALIDTDELDRIYPVPGDLPAVTERNLGAVWATFADRGATRLILVGVLLDQQSEREWIARAVPDARLTTVRLSAERETLAERIRDRERGSGLDAQLSRTIRQIDLLDAKLTDASHIVTDDVPLPDIARRVLVWSSKGRISGPAKGNLSGGGMRRS